MPERYRHPPLVELIAELQWGFPFPDAAQPQGVVIAAPGAHEDFFMRFAVQAGLLGYERTERLMPAGFASMPMQVVYRFRKKPPEEGTSLYQIGTGIFSANITPPYDSWQQFRPIVENGLRILLETRISTERQAAFTRVSLRYLNAFGRQFMERRSISSFVETVLGFRVQLPDALKNEIATNTEPKASLAFFMPAKSGQQMILRVGEGLVGSEQAAILDMTVGTLGSTPADHVAVMNVFDTANEVAHRVFVNLTTALSDKMGLISGDEA
jgi:uncharacterized protein (TIGR04255 family)